MFSISLLFMKINSTKKPPQTTDPEDPRVQFGQILEMKSLTLFPLLPLKFADCGFAVHRDFQERNPHEGLPSCILKHCAGYRVL